MLRSTLIVLVLFCGLIPYVPRPPDDMLPLFLSAYDNRLGGSHCDSDCSTVASGRIEPWMRGNIAACFPNQYGGRLEIPGVGSWLILDTGPAMGIRFIAGEWAHVCDVLVDLIDEPAPAWAGRFWRDWRIVYEP